MKIVLPQKPFLKGTVACLLMVMLVLSPLNALGLNLPVDMVKMDDATEVMEKDSDIVMVFVIGSSSYTVDGELMAMDVSPTIIEARTLLPIRFAATPLGADVGWKETDRKVTVLLGTTKIELWIGESKAVVNGQTVPIDADNPNVKPLILNDRTMLPLRFVTENLGCGVGWDEVTQKVTITKAKAVAKEDTGDISDSKKPGIDPVEIKNPVDIIGDLGTMKDPDEEEPEMKMPDASKLPEFKQPGQIIDVSKLPKFKEPEVLDIKDKAYYENYYGTVLTMDKDLLTTPGKNYQWGISNTKDMSLQYYGFYLKPEGQYDKYRADYYLDSSAKTDLIMEIHKDT